MNSFKSPFKSKDKERIAQKLIDFNVIPSKYGRYKNGYTLHGRNKCLLPTFTYYFA